MIQKKVCMLGTLNVGKTSVVRRYVDNTFSTKYHTTIGVKVDRKVVTSSQQLVSIMLWDMEGADRFNSLQVRYLRGAAGCIVVADGTRSDSLDQAVDIYELVREKLPHAAIAFAVNKSDLVSDWVLDTVAFSAVARRCGPPIFTSAKTGENVELMFEQLAQQMFSNDDAHTEAIDVSVA